MRPRLLCLCVLLSIFLPKIDAIDGMNKNGLHFIVAPTTVHKQQTKRIISPMAALDLVKERYASNFDKVETEDKEVYYYQLSLADYYLVYEGYGETKSQYLIHLYEFVIDDEVTQVGHTVTYGWYVVDNKTGKITLQE